jgi:hypothetical protein
VPACLTLTFYFDPARVFEWHAHMLLLYLHNVPALISWGMWSFLRLRNRHFLPVYTVHMLLAYAACCCLLNIALPSDRHLLPLPDCAAPAALV